MANAKPNVNLPSPWQRVLSKSQSRYYYFNPTTGVRLWELDEADSIKLPPSASSGGVWGWQLDETGKRQYVHLTSPTAVAGDKRSRGPEDEMKSVTSTDLHAKRSRVIEEPSPMTVVIDPMNTGRCSDLLHTLTRGGDAPALRKPNSLKVGAYHLQNRPEFPAAMYASLINLCKSIPGVGLPEIQPPVEEYKHGWFFPPHKVVLAELLNKDTKLILELGCWLGKSLLFMAEHAPNAFLVTVDLWDNTFIVSEQGDHYCSNERQVNMLKKRPLYETFISNAWSLRDRLVPMKMTTVEALEILAKVWGDAGIAPDLVYIDADHHYAPARADIEACIRAFPSAHIVGDDYDYPDVRAAAEDLGLTYNRVVHAEGGKCWTYSLITGIHREAYSKETEQTSSTTVTASTILSTPDQMAAFSAFSKVMSATIVQDSKQSAGASPVAVIRLLEDFSSKYGREQVYSWLNLPFEGIRGPGKGSSAVQLAARVGHVQVMALFLDECKCDVNCVTGGQAITPLGVAAYYGHASIVRLLLEHGADKSIRNKYGELPLDAARAELHEDCVALLRE